MILQFELGHEKISLLKGSPVSEDIDQPVCLFSVVGAISLGSFESLGVIENLFTDTYEPSWAAHLKSGFHIDRLQGICSS